jgi:hypothetical protein
MASYQEAKAYVAQASADMASLRARGAALQAEARDKRAAMMAALHAFNRTFAVANNRDQLVRDHLKAGHAERLAIATGKAPPPQQSPIADSELDRRAAYGNRTAVVSKRRAMLNDAGQLVPVLPASQRGRKFNVGEG